MPTILSPWTNMMLYVNYTSIKKTINTSWNYCLLCRLFLFINLLNDIERQCFSVRKESWKLYSCINRFLKIDVYFLALDTCMLYTDSTSSPVFLLLDRELLSYLTWNLLFSVFSRVDKKGKKSEDIYILPGKIKQT